MKRLFKKSMSLLMSMLMLIFALPTNVMAEAKTEYEVTNFAEFKEAVKAINDSTDDVEYTIHLKEDINFADVEYTNTQEYDIHLRKNVTILGNGHMINLGKHLSQGSLWIEADKILSLGKQDLLEESKLTLTSSPENGYRSTAAVIVGKGSESATFNMYEGVEITRNTTNGSSLGSAVNIINGTFNMYGGDIHHNINQGSPGVGGAVAGNVTASDVGVYNCTFNMYGGTIRENETNSTQPFAFGGGVFLERSNFSMHGGSINDNFITMADEKAKTYGAGIVISNAASDIVLDGGEISNNGYSHFGSGLYIRSSNVTIEKNFKIMGNKAKFGGGIYVGPGSLTIKNGVTISQNNALNGGGICNNGGTVVIGSGAIIANNKATSKADDISSYGTSITLAPAKDMNTKLTTDDSNKSIDAWYQDDFGKRWSKKNAILQDISNPIKDKVFLKAAHDGVLPSTVIFMNEDSEYAKVKVENGNTMNKDALTDESMPTNPSKEGYIFKAWNTGKDGKGTIFTGDTIVNEDMTVYAVWEKESSGGVDPYEDNEGGGSKPPTKTEEKPQPKSETKLNTVDHYAYMAGYPDLTFRADAQMTRAEVTMMFARLLKDRPVGTPFMPGRYSDVVESNWYSYAVDYMSEQNIVTGYPDGTFRPNAPITRAEFAAMSARFDKLTDAGNSTFTDVSANHWATKVIAQAGSKGWVSGYPDGTFKPNQNITRAEVVSSTNRILNRYADVEFAKAHKDELAPMVDIAETYWGYKAIVEAMNGHDYVRQADGKTEKWERLNGKAFTFPTPLAK